MTKNQAQHETTDSKASHTALVAITPQLRAAAQANRDARQIAQYGTDADIANTETIRDRADERANEAYARVYTGQGGDACHQGWSCDMDPAGDWWMENPNATDEAWLAELATWCWVDDEGNTHERTPAPKANKDAETLSERMAMAWFFVGSSGDEDSNRLVLRWVRQDDHASIAWLILSDHVLTDDDEAWELVQAIIAGGEAG